MAATADDFYDYLALHKKLQVHPLFDQVCTGKFTGTTLKDYEALNHQHGTKRARFVEVKGTIYLLGREEEFIYRQRLDKATRPSKKKIEMNLLCLDTFPGWTIEQLLQELELFGQTESWHMYRVSITQLTDTLVAVFLFPFQLLLKNEPAPIPPPVVVTQMNEWARDKRERAELEVELYGFLEQNPLLPAAYYTSRPVLLRQILVEDKLGLEYIGGMLHPIVLPFHKHKKNDTS